MSGIGLLNEKPLHASLKQWCARPGDRFEVPVDGFVIDIVRDDLLIEIQTRNLSAINSKLQRLTRSHQVRLIFPIVKEKWIVRTAATNSSPTIPTAVSTQRRRGRDAEVAVVRRKSPKRGRLEDLFWELVSIPQLLSNPNFSLEVLMIREEEVRRYDRRRRKGWVLERRQLLEVVDQHLFTRSEDWLAFVPTGLNSFTSIELATGMSANRELGQKLAYCLRHSRMIELIGKRGRANLYRVAGNGEE
ncbi:MAG: hypothetical protein DMF69_24520 [Acidobacteria bacterium]|nr:MAG: hypothetical protein DMF69_24520 [Acidobacteriota bacterium]